MSKNLFEYPNQQFLDLYVRLLKWFVFIVISVVMACLLYAFWPTGMKNLFDNKVYPSQEQLERREAQRAMNQAEQNWDKVENGIHLRTGLVYDENFNLINATCTPCHSAKLITQNRATREGWIDMIRWMQATQGLGDLGKNEPAIVQYLSEHYAPDQIGRRQNLDMETIEWYELE